MNTRLCTFIAIAAIAMTFNAYGQEVGAIPKSILTPDVVETDLGKLTFEDGAPTEQTAKAVADMLLFTNGLNVYNNSFRGASALAIQKGFASIGVGFNDVAIFPDLMDSASIFLTANADTVYYLSVVELAGQLASIGIVHGKPFSPDANAKRILTDAARFGNATGRVLNWRYSDMHPGWNYYDDSNWGNMLWEGGYGFETPPPMITKEGMFEQNPPTGARTLDSRTAFYFGYTLDSPGMIMRLPGVGSQYLMAFLDSKDTPFDGAQTYKVTLPKGIPAEAFWSFTVYDNQSRSMLATPQKYPRAGSQTYPSPAAKANADGSTTVYFAPKQPEGVDRGNWIQTTPSKGWFTILRLYSPLESFFTKKWQPTEIELVK